ncbi:hypothetical protein ACRQ5Q_24505 [Bradyrhizobium sp. PMVTL-01]|uniref:hypothetical protein n=1 Tax=Bradyrhizobium sp. PMVTL-01 TaxID=3434999 RepID=UPI003F70446F
MSEITLRIEAALAEVIAERGDKALASAFGLFLAGHKDELGRAAIKAMRDCSQGMRIAGHAALTESDACAADLGSQIGFGALGDAWRAMIDDALARRTP